MIAHRIASFRLVTLLALLASLLVVGNSSARSEVASRAQPNTPSAGAPLAAHLGPDGTLATAGFSGNLDPSGYAMSLGPNGEPRFVPAAQPAQTGDEFWDPRFGVTGVPDGGIRAMATDADGNLYVAGRFSEVYPNVPAKGIARWDGERWHTLGEGLSGGFLNIEQILISDETLYAVGDFNNAGGVLVNQIAQWDGSAWAAVGSGVGPRRQTNFGLEDGQINTAALGPDGSLYVGGYFNRIDGVPANSVARWDGTAWQALAEGIAKPGFEEGTTREADVYSMAMSPDGTLYVGGNFSLAGDTEAIGIASWDGAAWSALGAGLTNDSSFDPSGRVETIAVVGTQVFAGGYFTQAGGSPANNIAVWNGTAWSAMGSGVSKEFQDTTPIVFAMLPLDGMLYVGGSFTNAGNQNINGLARWNGTQWQPMPVALNDSNGVDVQALIAAPGGGFFAAGEFEKAAEQLIFNISRWNGTAWQPFGQAVSQFNTDPADIRTIAIDGAGRVYVGGQINYVSGIPVKNIAMWDGERWHDVGGGVSGESAIVYALVAVGDDVYAGGTFTQAGTIAAARVARWNSATGQWAALGGGIDNTVYALAYGDGLLFAGGAFAKAGTARALDVAIWNGTEWFGLGGDFEIFEVFDTGAEAGTFVRALAYANGELYMGGHFQVIYEKGQPTPNASSYVVVHNLASYNLDTEAWSLLGTNAQPGVTTDGRSGFGTDVNAMTIVGSGLYVGGTFNGAGGVAATNLARYELTNNTWSIPGNIGGVRDNAVEALASFGAELFVVGAFTSAGNGEARFVARYNTVTQAWSGLGSGLRWYNDTFTSANAVAVAPGGVYIGGKFDRAGPNPSLGFARWAGPLDGVDPGPDPDPNQTFRLYVPQVRN